MNKKINTTLAITIIIIIASIFGGIIYFESTDKNEKLDILEQEKSINTKQPTGSVWQNKIEQKPTNSEVMKGKTCKDSDGLDYYTKGELTVCDFETYEEPGANSPIGCTLQYDVCAGESNKLWEHYCDEEEYKFEEHECPNGCQDGICIK